MAGEEVAEVLVVVKAAPVLTPHLDEAMCVAGIRVDGGRGEWIRLHPVPFRDLADNARFRKYQQITVELIRHRTDRRPETRTPIRDSIILGETVGTQYGWAERRQAVAALPEVTMCELNRANAGGSGTGVPSLGVIRPIEPPALVISTRDDDQLAKWTSRAEAAKGVRSLFDNLTAEKPDFEVVPWRFSYRYHCAAPGCKDGRPHQQTIVDWEVVQLWRHVRHRPNWQELLRQKFEVEMWKGRDTVLFVGNQEEHPGSFLVLGVFWPPSTWQPPLL
jgi:hypothetical protein